MSKLEQKINEGTKQQTVLQYLLSQSAKEIRISATAAAFAGTIGVGLGFLAGEAFTFAEEHFPTRIAPFLPYIAASGVVCYNLAGRVKEHMEDLYNRGHKVFKEDLVSCGIVSLYGALLVDYADGMSKVNPKLGTELDTLFYVGALLLPSILSLGATISEASLRVKNPFYLERQERWEAQEKQKSIERRNK